MVSDLGSVARVVEQVNQWGLGRLPVLNREILAGRRTADAVTEGLTADVLTHLPSPDLLSVRQAQQLVVVLGLGGASVGRHYQEADGLHRSTPARAFTHLRVGRDEEPFCAYFHRLAERTGTGHCGRDSFASLVRWNVPAVEVVSEGQTLARLGSVFDDGLVRSYTGTGDEQRFFGLLKASEVLEKAVNTELLPMSDGSVDPGSQEALVRIARAVALLERLRELNRDFADRPPGRGVQVTHFMDVFRQFAVHWQPGDIPPSGALDPEALIRDLLVGIDMPSYPEHVHRVSAGLLRDERDMLSRLLQRPSLPDAALERADCTSAELATASAQEVHRLASAHPVLAALYLLLNAHSRVSGVHLQLTKKFLFDPQRARDAAGLGDHGVVSNRAGTTGMDESRLESLTRVRHHHVLAPLRVLGARTLESLASPLTPQSRTVTGMLVRFTGTALNPYDLGLPDSEEPRKRGQVTVISLDQAVPEHTTGPSSC